MDLGLVQWVGDFIGEDAGREAGDEFCGGLGVGSEVSGLEDVVVD
jgi:hypothetical protein